MKIIVIRKNFFSERRASDEDIAILVREINDINNKAMLFKKPIIFQIIFKFLGKVF